MASVYIQLPLVSSTVTGTISVTQEALIPTHAQSLIVDNVTVITFTAPAGAKKAKIMALDTNTANLRVTVDGSTAPSSTVGFQFQAGRSEDFDGVSSIKVICESVATNHGVIISWSV